MRGVISKSDFQKFLVHAGHVREFTLSNDRDGPGNRFNIAPDTFVRLGQLQNRHSPGPLFPALTRLRLINPVESTMSQLPLFLTPSLRSLDFMNVPTNQHSALLSFLITLVDEEPHLTTITFSSVFTTACLEACLNFKFLRHLELKEVNILIDFKLVIAIGALPELETLVLDGRRSCWEDSESKKPIKSMGFLCLKKFHITGTLGLIRFLYKTVGSEVLKDLWLTLVRTAPLPRRTPTMKLSKTSAPSSSAELDSTTRDFCNLIQEGLGRRTFKSIRLNQLLDYNDFDDWDFRPPSKPSDLPVTILDLLLEHTNLQHLEIVGWTLPETTFGPRILFRNTNTSNLKTIRLPVDSKASTISLIDLLYIAKSHPNLVFLQCGIKSLSNFTSPTLSVKMPSHGLKILSVGTSTKAADTGNQILFVETWLEAVDAIDLKQKMSIAAFLDALFPNLERIETQAGAGSKQWEDIYDLVKMCQTSRLIHANRHSASSAAGDGKE